MNQLNDEARRREKDLREAIKPWMILKADIMTRSSMTVIMRPDGSLSETIYPPETVSSLAEIDSHIKDMVAHAQACYHCYRCLLP